MASKRNTGTIQILGLNQRAAKETQALFAALEAFANLGDSFEDYEAFTAAHPAFWPVEFRKNVNLALGWGHDKHYHILTLAFRNYLRRIWCGGEDVYQQVLMILLGLAEESAAPKMDSPQPEGDADFRTARELVEQTHKGYGFAKPVIVADWARGEFSYLPLNDFQRAIYALWRESWKARTCPECGRLYIADRPPQLYCSVKCSTTARRKRDLALWHAKGDAQRRRRRKQARHKKGGAR
jgi:hypothetical protein